MQIEIKDKNIEEILTEFSIIIDRSTAKRTEIANILLRQVLEQLEKKVDSLMSKRKASELRYILECIEHDEIKIIIKFESDTSEHDQT